MSYTEIIYSLVVAIFALHFFFMYKFWRKTPKGTPFNIVYWVTDNSLQYISAWMGMILWLMLFDWDNLFAMYDQYILSKMPILGILKAHAVFAALAGFFNTKAFVWVGERVEEKLNIKK